MKSGCAVCVKLVVGFDELPGPVAVVESDPVGDGADMDEVKLRSKDGDVGIKVLRSVADSSKLLLAGLLCHDVTKPSSDMADGEKVEMVVILKTLVVTTSEVMLDVP